MNRRGFMTMLAGLPALASMPVVRAFASAPVPRTAKELEVAIEGLYASVEETNKRYEEFTLIGFGSLPDSSWPVYRVVPMSWRMRGDSEADLVKAAWKAMRDAAKGLEGSTLFWRKRPYCCADRDFESGQVDMRLRFRMGILPPDWADGVARSAVWMDSDMRRWARHFHPEGSVTQRLLLGSIA